MSAPAVLPQVAAPSNGATAVPWRVEPTRRRAVPPALVTDPDDEDAYAAAVDPMEVAALLETAGVSHDVALGYGRRDVFGLAQLVFDRIPFRATAAEDPEHPPAGGVRNLGRGLLFAAPAVFFAGGSVLSRGVAWWVLPVGLCAGWAASQLVPAVGLPLRSRHQHESDALVAALGILVAVAMAAGSAGAFLAVLGGRRMDVAVAVGIAAYLAASAVLLVEERDLVLATLVLPGLLVAGTQAARWPVVLPGAASGWAALGTLGLVVLDALHRVPTRRWRWPRLSPHERRVATCCLVHGAACGVLTSALVVSAHLWRTTDRVPAAAALPLLLSLGVMEWQLASHRHRVTTRRDGVRDVRSFVRLARVSLVWRAGMFAATLCALSAAVAATGVARGPDGGLALAAEGVLGVALYLGLVLVAVGRVGLVLVGWAAAAATVGAVALAAALLRGGSGPTPQALLVACTAGSGVAAAVLAASCWRVVASPFSY